MPQTSFIIFIVDPDKEVQNLIVNQLKSKQGVEVAGYTGDLTSALEDIARKRPDAVILNASIKGGTAFDFMDQCQEFGVELPPVILMAETKEFEVAQKALNNYRNRIMKIIKKPFQDDFDTQFAECTEALRSYYRLKKRRLKDIKKAIYIRQGNFTYRLRLDEIDYIEVGGSGSIIIVLSDGQNIQVQQTLSSFMQDAPDRLFRIHRNNAINIDKISHVDHEDRLVYLRGQSRGLSIGRTYYPAINQLMNGD